MGNEIQKDLILDPNSFAFVLDETKGNISCWVGPIKTSLSQSDKLVRFNNKSKKFVLCENYEDAIQSFITVPEGWYCVLKNPAENNCHPIPGTSNSTPTNLQIGHKVNINGPTSFALYPGQMVEVIQGHYLKSNQYLVAKVYDEVNLHNYIGYENVYDGKTFLIKGIDECFYIPMTGIEIVKTYDGNYVREAVILESLEYCILKDENGNKRYIHGPNVVFPTVTETFLLNSNNSPIFKAIELSPLSGVYVKIVADYDNHKTGEELFITGNETAIYYPRPEHALISYEGKTIHYAIAIPEGEGQYIMNRRTGEIKTVRGPAMYLPDPREEVVVKRTLTKKQCELLYPNNPRVLVANGYFDSHVEESNAVTYYSKGIDYFNRSNTYIPPRTINLDNSKYEGAVTIKVWPNYAVNVISGDGTRETVIGPKNTILDYDQTLETVIVDDEETVYLKMKDNIVKVKNYYVETLDGVGIKLDFQFVYDLYPTGDLFCTNNHAAKIKRAVCYSIDTLFKRIKLLDFLKSPNLDGLDEVDFLDTPVILQRYDFVDVKIADLVEDYNHTITSHNLDLEANEFSSMIEQKIAVLKEQQIRRNASLERLQAQEKAATEKQLFELNSQAEIKKIEQEQAIEELRELLEETTTKVFELQQERIKREREAAVEYKQKINTLDIEREKASAESLTVAMSSISPKLAAAMENTFNKDIIMAIAKAVSPYAIAQDSGVADTITKLLRGTPLEQLVKIEKTKDCK